MEPVTRQLAVLLETAEVAALGPGPRAGRQTPQELDHRLETIFRETEFHAKQQTLIRALILLWHDHLDEAHSLAQDISSVDGSFIHGIMHRREPDYGNAKYWFHRVGAHPVFPDIARRVSSLAPSPNEQKLLHRFAMGEAWDPFAFIDSCQEEAGAKSGRAAFLQRVQQAEFSGLLEYLALL